MKKIIFIFFVVTLIVGCVKLGTREGGDVINSEEILYGYWSVVGYKWAGYSSSEEKDPKRFIGSMVYFAGNQARIIDSICESPKYSFSKNVNIVEYLLNDRRATSAEVGIATSIIDIVDVKCTNKNNLFGIKYGARVFIINKNNIIYETEGPFFYLQRVKK